MKEKRIASKWRRVANGMDRWCRVWVSGTPFHTSGTPNSHLPPWCHLEAWGVYVDTCSPRLHLAMRSPRSNLWYSSFAPGDAGDPPVGGRWPSLPLQVPIMYFVCLILVYAIEFDDQYDDPTKDVFQRLRGAKLNVSIKRSVGTSLKERTRPAL